MHAKNDCENQFNEIKQKKKKYMKYTYRSVNIISVSLI